MADVEAVVGLDEALEPASGAITMAGVTRAVGSATFADVRVIYREQ